MVVTGYFCAVIKALPRSTHPHSPRSTELYGTTHSDSLESQGRLVMFAKVVLQGQPHLCYFLNIQNVKQQLSQSEGKKQGQSMTNVE